MNIKRAAAGGAIAALLPFAGPALAQKAPVSEGGNADLRREIEDQKQRLAMARPTIEGAFGGIYDFRLMPEFYTKRDYAARVFFQPFVNSEHVQR